jgi:membrane protein CcdC involved in cytochrome C biogenesis
VQQSAGIFFILAFGMIVRWRGKMLVEYRGLTGGGGGRGDAGVRRLYR